MKFGVAEVAVVVVVVVAVAGASKQQLLLQQFLKHLLSDPLRRPISSLRFKKLKRRKKN